jgi:MAF protein
MDFVLASESPRRRELLALIGLSFKTLAPRISEQQLPGETPVDYVCRLSREKAQAAYIVLGLPALILAADTIVLDGDDILGKPADAQEAASMLRRLRGRTHQVYTAVALLEAPTGRLLSELAVSPVSMRPYTEAEITAYINTGDPFDKAGAYGIQHQAFHPAEGFQHCFANVMGLPICHVTRLLRRAGLEVNSDVPTACQAHLNYVCPVYEAILNGRA